MKSLASSTLGYAFGMWLLAGAGVLAAPQTFDFKDPKGVNNAVFLLDAPLESINGTANGVSGTVTYDAADPASLKGKIVVDSSSLHVTNPMMKEHMQGKDWLDVANHKQITFEVSKLGGIKATGDEVNAEVTGNFILKGVTKELTVPVRLTYLPGKLANRTGGRQQGDLLVIRSTFKISRSDFGINPSASADTVSNEIQITLSLAGASPKS